MNPAWLVDWVFLLAAMGTALVAGYQAVVRETHAKALRTGAISVLWLSVILIDGYYDILVSIIAIGTIVLVWVLTQERMRVQRP
ncbi:hypothetical protein [Haladaptatus halobius]|jgi:hypothetical protein|uniref:hypothetical protein n=1 Tax=Haladaptatus halobius TaxID=2884875 RepID=UPI001D0A9E3C|nr:hypothetical protein [Haladaptatus halobius]